MIIELENIKGYRFNNEIVCVNCITVEETDNSTQNEIITTDEIENNSEANYYCDRCKELL